MVDRVQLLTALERVHDLHDLVDKPGSDKVTINKSTLRGLLVDHTAMIQALCLANVSVSATPSTPKKAPARIK